MNRFTAPRTGWCRRFIGASAVGAAAAAFTLAGTSSALAAQDYLQFSLDGETYSRSISGPIFRESLTYIPGDEARSSVWIRNTSGEPARLSSAAVMVSSDPELNRQLGLTAGPATALGARVPLGSQGSCTDIPGAWDLGSGEELELSLVVDLSMDAPNDTMNRTADFDVFFLLESEDAQQRTACEALAGPGELPPGLVAAPGTSTPAQPQTSSTELTSPAGSRASSPVVLNREEERFIAGGVLPAARPGKSAVPMEQPPAGITPAGYQSTVEPVIRSLPGTLFIAVSVLFAAAVIIRFKESRYE